MIVSITRTGAGSGYTDGTGYALGFSGGGGSGAAGTFDVVGGQVTNLVLTDGGSGYTSNPTVSFSAAGGGTGATATVTRRNQCCFDSLSGSYDLTASATGFASTTATISTSPCQTKFVTLPSNATVRVNVDACLGGLSGGMNVAVIQGGVTIASGTTDSNRNVTFLIPPGVQTTFTATDPVYGRLAPTSVTSGPGGYGGCGTTVVLITMVPATGYRCFPVGRFHAQGCPVPASETLQLNDSRYGPCTLTYDPVDAAWKGIVGSRNYRLSPTGNGSPITSFRFGTCEVIDTNASNINISNCPPSLVCTIGVLFTYICGATWQPGDVMTITE